MTRCWAIGVMCDEWFHKKEVIWLFSCTFSGPDIKDLRLFHSVNPCTGHKARHVLLTILRCRRVDPSWEHRVSHSLHLWSRSFDIICMHDIHKALWAVFPFKREVCTCIISPWLTATKASFRWLSWGQRCFWSPVWVNLEVATGFAGLAPKRWFIRLPRHICFPDFIEETIFSDARHQGIPN